MNKIEFGEFRYTDKHKQSVLSVLESNWLTMGPKVAEFENKFKSLFDYKHCILTSSGTAADTSCCLLLYELGAKPGDEIIIPGLTFIATAEAVKLAGFNPVLVDVDFDLQINVELIEKAITEKTKAIMAVSLMGKPCKLDRIRQICDKYNLLFILDNCEAYGSKYQGKYSLEYADLETTSHFNAHLTFSVEGGAVFTNNKDYDRILRAIRSHGRYHGNYFQHDSLGFNFKPSDLHASIGCVELDDFYKIWNIRKRNWYIMRDGLSKYDDVFHFVNEDINDINCPHGFSVVLKRPDHTCFFKDSMEKANIHIKRNFGSIDTHKPFYDLPSSCPVAKYIGHNGVHWGVHQYLSDENVHYIIKTISDIAEELRNK